MKHAGKCRSNTSHCSWCVITAFQLGAGPSWTTEIGAETVVACTFDPDRYPAVEKRELKSQFVYMGVTVFTNID